MDSVNKDTRNFDKHLVNKQRSKNIRKFAYGYPGVLDFFLGKSHFSSWFHLKKKMIKKLFPFLGKYKLLKWYILMLIRIQVAIFWSMMPQCRSQMWKFEKYCRKPSNKREDDNNQWLMEQKRWKMCFHSIFTWICT